MKPKPHKSCGGNKAGSNYKLAHACHQDVKKPETESEGDSDEGEEDDFDFVTKGFRFKCSIDEEGSEWNCSAGPSSHLAILDGLDIDIVLDKGRVDSVIEDYDSLCASIREKREQLSKRLQIYNSLLKFHKSIKEDQMYLYRKLQDTDELYLRNTAAILRLGFCPCLVHQQTSHIGDKLMKIHRKLRIWDRKMDAICDIIKEPTSQKTASTILHLMMKVNEQNKLEKSLTDLDDIVLPQVVWDLNNTFFETLGLSELMEDWRNFRNEIRENLCKVEIKFQEVCLEFGITKRPAAIPSSSSKFFSDQTGIEDNEDEDAKKGNNNPDQEFEGGGGDHDDKDVCVSPTNEISSFL